MLPPGTERSATGHAVDAETGGRGIAGGPGALEAERLAAARRDGGVVAQVRCGDALAGLADGRVPGIGDLLITGERERECPAIDRRRTSVADGDVGREPALPVARAVG